MLKKIEKANHGECLRAIMPVRDALDVINGKWKLPIIIAMSSGNKRFSDIQKQVPKITAKVLSKELKDLETHQLLKRTVYDTLPVTVEYTLLPYADTLENVIIALHNWGVQHRKVIIGK